MQDQYAAADWSGIRRDIADPATASRLVNRMRFWRAEGVQRLRLHLVYTKRLTRARSIGSVEFSADARALPGFSIFVFQTSHGVTRVVGTATGIKGTTFANANWKLSRISNFRVYHSPYQLAGTDRHFLQDLVFERRQFAREFGVKLPSLAAFYLYPTQALMSRLTGRRCGARKGEVGCTNPFSRPPSIQSTLLAIYHEPIHVYELALEPPPLRNGLAYVAPLFIGEGTAVALQDREADVRLSDYCSDLAYVPLDGCARQSMGNVRPLSLLSDSGFKKANAGDAYALGGSFVKYLILQHGYRAFGRFYYQLAAQPKDRISDYNVASKRVYRATIQRLISSWSAALCRGGC